MSNRARTNATSESKANSIISTGEIFPDGGMIELVSSSTGVNQPDLLLWNGSEATVEHRVEHIGCIYEAPELPPTLYRATRWPSHCTDYGSARCLFDGISDLFRRHLDLSEQRSSLLACFAISTWLADRLPTAPILLISGFEQEPGIDVFRLVSCVCRRAVMLAEVTPAGFRSLPMELSLTLLLIQQELKPNLQRLLRASNYRGLRLAGNRGGLTDLYGPKAICCGDDAAVDALGGGVIHVFVGPAQFQSGALDEQVQNDIAKHFQPRLLMYRLKNAPKVRECRVDVSQITFATRQLARSLAMCFPEDLELASDIVELLRPQDEDARAQRANSIEFAIVEVLLGLIHEQKS